MKDIEFELDYGQFTAQEVVFLVRFFHAVIEADHKKNVTAKLIAEYKTYRSLVNSISMEKQLDKMLQKKAGVSIRKTMEMSLKGGKQHQT